MPEIYGSALKASYSAPKLSRLSLVQSGFDPAQVVDQETSMAEQREVNAGVRATFSSINSTMRSQGAAIRGIEELLKRALPEIDRLSRNEKAKADLNSVDKVIHEVGRLGEVVGGIESNHRETLNALEGKFDKQLGQQALDALARHQQHAEHEMASREAVNAEVVRLAASIASFSTTVEAVGGEAKVTAPRILELERRSDATEAAASSVQAENVKLAHVKADVALVDALRREVSDATEHLQKKLSQLDGDGRRGLDSLVKALETKMGSEEAQRAHDALSEQVAAQASLAAQANARLGDALSSKLDKSESAAKAGAEKLERELLALREARPRGQRVDDLPRQAIELGPSAAQQEQRIAKVPSSISSI